jgi:hypothetical protein
MAEEELIYSAASRPLKLPEGTLKTALCGGDPVGRAAPDVSISFCMTIFD